MDEPMKKSGTWPNVAVPAGSDAAAVMAAHGVGSRQDDGRDVDTREKLEADVASILRNAASHTSVNTSIGDMLRYTVPGSGAAPWQLEEDACEALASIAERQIAELTAERDELQAAIDAMGNGQMYAMYSEACAERDRLQRVVRTQADSFKALEREIADLKADNAKHGQ